MTPGVRDDTARSHLMSSQLGWNQPGGEVLNFSSREKVDARSSSRHEEPLRQGGPHVALKEQFRDTYTSSCRCDHRQGHRWCALWHRHPHHADENKQCWHVVSPTAPTDETRQARIRIRLPEVVSMRIQFFQYSSGNTRA